MESLVAESCGKVGEEDVQSPSKLMELARSFNCFFINKLNSGSYKPFIIDNYQVGIIAPEVLEQLQKYPEVFVIGRSSVKLHPRLCDYDSRTNDVDKVLREIKEQNIFVALKGWRDECYEVRAGFNDKSLMRLERAAACMFGIRAYGVDINGYVMDPKKGLCIWLQKRSQTKQTWPGRLDNMVGGGMSVGYSVLETAHKEAGEEASVPGTLLKNLKAAGSVSIYFESERGLFPNTEIVFDLQLPLDFVPVNQDGEVESFHLVTAQEALDIILSPSFKTTSCAVALDFLVRKGFINETNEPNLLQLRELFHVSLDAIYKKISH